jgi:hypothetical protein
VKKMLTELRDAWSQVSTGKNVNKNSQNGGGVNLAG